MDLSDAWSVEVAVGEALDLAGRQTAQLGAMAGWMSLLASCATALTAVMTRPLAGGDEFTTAATMLGGGLLLLALSALQILSSAVIFRRLIDLTRGQVRGFPGAGRVLLMSLWMGVGSFGVGFVGTFGLLFFIAPGLIVFAATHVYRYALVDGDGPLESFRFSWVATRHGWIRLLVWQIAFYGLGFVGGLLGEFAEGALVKAAITGLFTFVSCFILWPADISIYVQMRRAWEERRG